MPDFTSALYLGMGHAHDTLRPWARLTTGRPAALCSPPEAGRVARGLARLLRCESATLAPSTLHLFLDLFDVLATARIAIYADAGIYPIVRRGVEQAASKGVSTTAFPTHDPAALEHLLHRDQAAGRRPVVVADGLCPATGRPAPLPDYLRLVRERNGYLVIDDTQALGMLGRDRDRMAPYGRGGAGSPAWHGIDGPELIVGSSLAKSFGAPLAVLAGAAGVISRYEDSSATRVHCSPPSLAALGAAERALAVNARHGDDLRRRLARLVTYFRDGLHRIGLSASGGLFPVQTLRAIPGVDPARLHEWLSRRGVAAVLHKARDAGGAALGFLITVLHTPGEIDRCVGMLECARTHARNERDGTRRGVAR